MRIVLLQDEIYLPSLAGGTKANRLLLEAFVRGGHECLALTRALTRSPDGPRDRQQFLAEMERRCLRVSQPEPEVFSSEYRGVRNEALDFPTDDARRAYLTDRIQKFQPDWVLVADDKRRFMLDSAARAAPERVIPLLQTIMQLPFGPLSVDVNPRQTQLMKQAPAIIVISEFFREYVAQHGGMTAKILHMPVYGEGPFRQLGRFDSGFVTMINPCELKGLAIFLALAREFPTVDFAAVPTWGATQQVLDDLQRQPNVRILPPADDIEEVLAQTRILVAPSLWPETFGYVVPEAMVRGIPVLASNIGGLPEAKLGVDYLLPVKPAERREQTYICPTQDVSLWATALDELISDPATYARCSAASREAALEFVSRATREPFETFLTELAAASPRS